MSRSGFGSTTSAKDISIGEAIERAGWAASYAYKGKAPGPDTKEPAASDEERRAWAHYSEAYSRLAAVKQAERDYEERKFQEILEAGRGDA